MVEPLIGGPAPRVMSLRDGTKKMSKSDASDQSRINLTDDADTIAAKIRKAKTDPEPLPDTADGLKDRPEARNLVNIYAALAGHTVDQVVRDFAGAQFGTFKPALADLAVAKLSPITSEMNRLMADPAEIDRILGDGAERADQSHSIDVTGGTRTAIVIAELNGVPVFNLARPDALHRLQTYVKERILLEQEPWAPDPAEMAAIVQAKNQKKAARRTAKYSSDGPSF